MAPKATKRTSPDKSLMPALPSHWIEEQVARLPQMLAAARRSPAAAPRAESARFDAASGRVVIELSNGAAFALPARVCQGLEGASDEDLSEIEVSPAGDGLHWPRLDVDLSVRGLLLGQLGSDEWMREHAARAGRARTPAKAAAARVNGRKGGRPRKERATAAESPSTGPSHPR